jgi:hypothetical protein
MYAYEGMFLKFSGSKRSGRNLSASGPQNSLFLCTENAEINTVAPFGIILPAENVWRFDKV